MTQLTTKDIENLLDALTAWEYKDQAGQILGQLIDGLMLKDAPIPPAMIVEKAHVEAEQRRAKEERLEQSIMLKAKLLTIRGELVVAQAEGLTHA